MDPTTALKNAREAADAILRSSLDDRAELAVELAEAFEALDEWLSLGGFKPEEWNRTHASGQPG
jgi:hypothetical protein